MKNLNTNPKSKANAEEVLKAIETRNNGNDMMKRYLISGGNVEQCKTKNVSSKNGAIRTKNKRDESSKGMRYISGIAYDEEQRANVSDKPLTIRVSKPKVTIENIKGVKSIY